MQVSAECRWFWRDSEAGCWLRAWFTDPAKHNGMAAGGGVELRPDSYLEDYGQSELGVKRRGNKSGVEVKGLVGVVDKELEAAPFIATIELWSKWTTKALSLNSLKTVNTSKLRWLRKFDTSNGTVDEIKLGPDELRIDHAPLPSEGCNVEFTEVKIEDRETWYTMGFEAFGELHSIEFALRACAAEMARRTSALPTNGHVASYPLWFSKVAG